MHELRAEMRWIYETPSHEMGYHFKNMMDYFTH